MKTRFKETRWIPDTKGIPGHWTDLDAGSFSISPTEHGFSALIWYGERWHVTDRAHEWVEVKRMVYRLMLSLARGEKCPCYNCKTLREMRAGR